MKTMTMEPEYRCTRRTIYMAPSCPGNTDRLARQGHYIRAESAEVARRRMEEQYPEDIERAAIFGVEPFTVDIWKE